MANAEQSYSANAPAGMVLMEALKRLQSWRAYEKAEFEYTHRPAFVRRQAIRWRDQTWPAVVQEFKDALTAGKLELRAKIGGSIWEGSAVRKIPAKVIGRLRFDFAASIATDKDTNEKFHVVVADAAPATETSVAPPLPAAIVLDPPPTAAASPAAVVKTAPAQMEGAAAITPVAETAASPPSPAAVVTAAQPARTAEAWVVQEVTRMKASGEINGRFHGNPVEIAKALNLDLYTASRVEQARFDMRRPIDFARLLKLRMDEARKTNSAVPQASLGTIKNALLKLKLFPY